MICPFSNRCSSERHALVSHWLNCQLHRLVFLDHKESSHHTCSLVDDQYLRARGFRLRLHSCKLSLQATNSECKILPAAKTQPKYYVGRNACIYDFRTSKFRIAQSMAGSFCGTNAAMEANYATDSFKKDQEDKVANQSSASNQTITFSGVLCNSVTTVGKSTNIAWQECMVKKEERQKLLGQKGCVIWVTGLSGSGKSTLACTLEHALLKRGNLSYVVDGDNLRHGLNNNLGFSAEDRTENIRRVGEVARLFADAGVICIASVISPYRKDRQACRELLHPGEFIEVFMNFPVSLCEERDPKGLYKLARAGKIKGFTGIDDPYEAPLNCEVVVQPINGRCPTPTEMACQLMSYLEEKGILGPPRQL